MDGLFVQRVKRSGTQDAYRYFDRGLDDWNTYTWDDMGAMVARWQDALSKEGLQPGDRVALLLCNCPEWVIFDQACLGLGLVLVPLYTDDRPDNIAYILEDAAVSLLLVQDAGRWRKLAPALHEEGALERVLILESGNGDQNAGVQDARVRMVQEWLPEKGGRLRQRQGDPHELASIVYTSGTTGRSKGVMLSHYNMLSIAHASLTVLDCYLEDVFLSFLPLSHTLERTAGYYIPVMTGSMVAYSRSIAQLADDLQQVRPTVLISVPRIFERVYGKVKDKMSKGSAIARWLFNSAVNVGWHRFLVQQGKAGWRPKLLFWPLLNKLVASKITSKLGGNLRVAVSGGAPLTPEIAQVFIGLAIPIIQGYGLTETSPVISVNPLDNNEPVSVGLPLRGVEVRIGENDELQVRSPGVMLGYWNNHAATKQIIDPDGWLHTGDQARFEDEHIFITGRLKDILVLSNGEKVPPGDMEMAIALNPLFEQVMVVGEGRPYLTALVVLAGDFWPGLAQDCGVDPMSPESMMDQKVLNSVMRHINDALRDFPGYAKIRRVTLLLEPWSVDNGLSTPTLKVKRAKVLERFEKEVDGMYKGGPAAGSRQPALGLHLISFGA
ncbi:long-chain fatty acid--CoA ligase [Solemya velesiana gill symbiont]|uniref:Long-chain fatty acid--CoA ligase n=1 Tax=Solemya velesiana gill symbiont TaxID=1918948 RepID=A0A1T2KXI6_9GAMM|nr:long-chain fatty acid--CoA ligase [Solemya velesiana gill symbiont]